MYVILGHENPDVDSIVSGVLLERYLNRHGKEAKFIIPDLYLDKESVDLCLSYGIDPREHQESLSSDNNQYILVDHHERDVLGDIVGVIDHHPTVQKYSYPYYRNEEASSTVCLLVKGMEKEFTRDEVLLALLATMVDTISLHSSKTKEEDIKWVKETCQKYQFDFHKLYQDGLCLTDLSSPDVYLNHGLKNYSFADQKIASSSISLYDISKKENDITYASSLVFDYMRENSLDQFIMVIHDMKDFHSTIIYYSPNRITFSNYDNIVSRGSDIIPQVERRCLVKDRK